MSYFKTMPVDWRPFISIIASKAIKAFRALLLKLDAQGAGEYRCHDLRRCHADDLRERGYKWAYIVARGEWRSLSFLDHADLLELEIGVVLKAHDEEPSGEEEEGQDG